MLKNGMPEEKVETLLSTGQIPIIDLAHSGTDQKPSRSVVNRVAVQLHKALSEKGVAFLVNHGICDEKMQSAWSYLDQFCDLPTDTKEVYIRKGDDNQGYIKPGQERFEGNDMELRHAFNICTLSAAANLPEEPLPGFREHVAELASEFKSLTTVLLQALAIGLHLDINYFLENHSHMLSGNHDNETTLRLLYYPPIVEDDNKCEMTKGRCKYSYQRCAMDRPDLGPDDEQPAGGTDNSNIENSDYVPGHIMTRCGAHCDYGSFTLLSQDSEGGLEVKLPGNEKWKRVGHLPGAILLNSGNILAMWTENKYPALLHRVIIPEQASIRSRGRHSMAFFCHPDNCTEIAPLALPSTEVADTKPQRHKSFKVAKDKVSTAYHLIQKKFRQTYGHSNDNSNGNSNGNSNSNSNGNSS